jgi:phosphoserine phosphatase RsbU/P
MLMKGRHEALLWENFFSTIHPGLPVTPVGTIVTSGMFWVTLVLALALAAALYALWSVHRVQKREIKKLRQARQELHEEERAVLEFLHHLSESLDTAQKANAIHELIVKGVTRVLKAKGGALYILDESSQRLIPSSYSAECPPLVPLPERVIIQSKSQPGTILSFLRLHSIGILEGFLGQAYAKGEAASTDDLLPTEGQTRPMLRQIAVMTAPLVHQGKKLGVLAVANDRVGRRFSANDFHIFLSVAEQSAYALGNSILQGESEAKRRLEEEIRNASEIQRILLPGSSPEIKDYEIEGINIPAKVVSGDYYDYIPIDEQHLGVVIGDVSGKGIPASLLMAMCRTALRVVAPGNLSPRNALSVANRLLFPDIREDMFISLAYVVLDRLSNLVSFARAGHDAPLLFRASTGEVQRLEVPGLALGVDKGTVFDRVMKDHQLRMEDGDCLLLYTDGVNEAFDRQGREFGMARLTRLFQRAAPKGSKAVIESITQALNDFMSGYPQSDDITLVAVKKVTKPVVTGV